MPLETSPAALAVLSLGSTMVADAWPWMVIKFPHAGDAWWQENQFAHMHEPCLHQIRLHSEHAIQRRSG